MSKSRGRSSKDEVGRKSPPSESVKEAQIQGASSGPQGEQTPPRTPKQPPQTSNRRPARHEQEPQARKSFSPEEDPNMQGLPHTKPDVIKRHQGMQGLGGRSQASGTRSDDVSETARAGEPDSEHARAGRQHDEARKKR
jgi:hypothetical protein